MELKLFLEEIKTKIKHTKNKIVVDLLDERVIQFLNEKDVPVHTKEIYLTHKGLAHLARESKKKEVQDLVKKIFLEFQIF